MQHYGVNGYSLHAMNSLSAMYNLHQQAAQQAQHAPDYRPSVHALTLAERLAGNWEHTHAHTRARSEGSELNLARVFPSFPTVAHSKTSSWRLVTAPSTASSGAAARPSPRSSWRRWRRPSRRPTIQMWWWGSGWPCAPTCPRPECRYECRQTTRNQKAVVALFFFLNFFVVMH